MKFFMFCPQRPLFNAFGEEEFVDIYTKFNIIEYGNKKRVITISFHKGTNQSSTYLGSRLVFWKRRMHNE